VKGRLTSTDLQGDIMDLNQARRSSTLAGKATAKHPTQVANRRGTPQIIEAQFVQDIDNFEGVKNIRNYCISCIKDDGYAFGERSVGVLHIFNKTNEDKKIDKNDIARI